MTLKFMSGSASIHGLGVYLDDVLLVVDSKDEAM